MFSFSIFFGLTEGRVGEGGTDEKLTCTYSIIHTTRTITHKHDHEDGECTPKTEQAKEKRGGDTPRDRSNQNVNFTTNQGKEGIAV